jgi:hypothetical protein
MYGISGKRLQMKRRPRLPAEWILETVQEQRETVNAGRREMFSRSPEGKGPTGIAPRKISIKKMYRDS